MVALGITHGLRWFFVLGMGVFSPRFLCFGHRLLIVLSRLENRAVGLVCFGVPFVRANYLNWSARCL